MTLDQERADEAVSVAEPPREPELAAAASEPVALDIAQAWPVTRLADWSLTLLLAAVVVAPEGISASTLDARLSLVVPAMAATLGARSLFEVIAFGSWARRPATRLAAAVPPALIAGAVMLAAALIAGLSVPLRAAAATSFAALCVLSLASAIRAVEARVHLGLRRVYFVGLAAARADLEHELRCHRFARLVGSRAHSAGSCGVETLTAGLVQEIVASNATMLLLDGYAMREPRLVEAAASVNLKGVRVRALVSYYEDVFKKVPLGELSPGWFLFDIGSIHRRGAYRDLRRIADVAIAACVLVLLLPVLFVAAVVVKVTSSGPVLYRQRRVGMYGAPFTLLKLRTMRETAAADPIAAWASAETHRITAAGRILRRFRIDEIPQLWNVVRGDLALVGPRPEQPAIVERLKRDLPHYDARHCLRPGLTGWAQVTIGYAGSPEGAVAKLQRDLYYVKHQSLRLDLLVIWLTLRAVLAGCG